jgi:hypothetical protein
LGGFLASAGHRLIVPPAENGETAEYAALEGLRKIARYSYETCSNHADDPPLKAHFDAVEKSDAVILIGGFDGTYASGLTALRRRKLIIPIPAFGGSAQDLCDIDDIGHSLEDRIRNLDINEQGWKKKMVDAIRETLNGFPKLLIIHGRGSSGERLKKYISAESKNKKSLLFGLAIPVIMNLSGKGADSVPSVFEGLASQFHAIIAIATADDIGGFASRKQ